MKIERDQIVPLGYGKYFRSESIVGLEPIEMGERSRHGTLLERMRNRKGPAASTL